MIFKKLGGISMAAPFRVAQRLRRADTQGGKNRFAMMTATPIPRTRP